LILQLQLCSFDLIGLVTDLLHYPSARLAPKDTNVADVTLQIQNFFSHALHISLTMPATTLL
jgi:hypothetical protein